MFQFQKPPFNKHHEMIDYEFKLFIMMANTLFLKLPYKQAILYVKYAMPLPIVLHHKNKKNRQ